MRYEHRRQKLAGDAAYCQRIARQVGWATALMTGTLGVGMVGYRLLEGMSWIDAYLNATMILGGMGPVSELRTDAGKLFAGTYALLAGLVFVAGISFVLAPVLHRGLHKFHLGEDEKE